MSSRLEEVSKMYPYKDVNNSEAMNKEMKRKNNKSNSLDYKGMTLK